MSASPQYGMNIGQRIFSATAVTLTSQCGCQLQQQRTSAVKRLHWRLITFRTLLHLGLNVITFRTLLHLGPNVISFSTLLHLGPMVITFRTSTGDTSSSENYATKKYGA